MEKVAYEIQILTEPLKWTWHYKDLDQFLGGTQAWTLELARALKKRGHLVTIYWDNKEDEWEGVSFRERSGFTQNAQITIVQNPQDDLFTKYKNLKNVFIFSNNPTAPNWNPQLWEKVSCSVLMSEFHQNLWKGQLESKKTSKTVEATLSHIYPGIDPEEFDPKTKVERNPNLAIYASSWDRGLRNLIGHYPAIKRKFPKLELVVTYSPNFMSKIVKEWSPVPMEWRNLGIRFEEKNRLAMGRLYREASFMLYPCKGIEMFCMSSWKAQSQGCLAINSDVWALPETTIRGTSRPLTSWLEDALWILGDKKSQAKLLSRDLAAYSWDEAAAGWEILFEDVKEKKS